MRKFKAVSFSVSMAVLLAVVFPPVVAAQTDPVFIKLRDQQLVTWDAAKSVWVRKGEWAEIRIAEPRITFKDRFYSLGRRIVIATEELDFTPTALISSGFPSPAPSGVQAGDNGKPGLKAGDIEIIAGSLLGINVSAAGQDGGNGIKGQKGDWGRDGVGASGDGGPATCFGGNPKKEGGRRGDNSTVPSENGSVGRVGKRGGNAGDGGNGGVISIRYLTSALNIDALSSETWREGRKGIWGAGGDPGGGGGPGPRGQRGSEASCDCECKCAEWEPPRRPDPREPDTTRPSRCIEYSCHTCTYPGGAPGPLGEHGPNGTQSGEPGGKGNDGKNGQFIKSELSREEYTRLISQLVPTSDPAKLEEAENFFAINRFTEAKSALNSLSGSRDQAVKHRASLLLKQLECGRNYFNRPMAWAPVYFSNSEPRTLDWVLDELEKQGSILVAAETQLSYRQEKKKKTDRVLAAYESEIQQLANQRIDARAAIDEYEDAIKTLEERLKLLERFGQEIESKMREAQQSLLQLPNEVGRDAEAITTALSGGISNILAAGASYPGNIPGVLSNLGNALGLFSSAAKRGTELVEKLQRINVEQSLRQHMFNLSDRMAALVDKTLEGGGELRRAQVRKAYAERRQKRIDEMVQRLELLKLSEEPEKLEELLRIAEEIYAETRRRVGQTVDEYRRFADIVMRSTQAREPLSLPRGGGIRSIFNASHLDSIRSEERARYNQFSTEPPQTKTEKFTLTRSGEGKFPDFFRTLDSAINAEGTTSKYRTIQIPGSQLIDHIPYIAGARIRKVGFRLLGDNGVVSPSQFYIRHSGATGGRSNDGPLYQVATMSQRMLINEPDLPIFLFWFRSLQDAWEWSFPEKPKGAVNGVEISVDLELANLADASRSEPRRAQLLPQGVLPSCIADSP